MWIDVKWWPEEKNSQQTEHWTRSYKYSGKNLPKQHSSNPLRGTNEDYRAT